MKRKRRRRRKMTVTCPSMTCGEMKAMSAKLMLNQNLNKPPQGDPEVNPGLRIEAGEAEDLYLQALPVQVLIHLGAEVGGRDGLGDLARGTKGGGVVGDIP